MNVPLLRTVDAWLGLPAALLLGLVPRQPRARPERPATVVIVKLFGLGSILATAGVVRAFREQQPGCRVLLLTFAAHASLGRLLDVYDEIVCVRSDSTGAVIQDVWRVWRRLRSLQPDLVVDIEYFSKLSTVFCASLGNRYRLGFLLPARWRRRLLDEGIAFREDIHFSECVARLLAPWGVDYRVSHATVVRADDAATARAAMLLDGGAATGTSGRWVMVNPNAHALCVERRWPVERFAALIDTLAVDEADLRFAVLGAPDERPLCEDLLSRLPAALRPRCRNFAGATDLPAAAAVLARAGLFVTNDSGLMHLGAAVGTPTVALFGPESPLRYRPLLPGDRLRVLQGDVPCGPCLTYMNRKHAPCEGRNVCMAAISVEQVADACRSFLYDGRHVERSSGPFPLTESTAVDPRKGSCR